MLAIQSMGGNAFAQSMLQGGVGEALVDCFGPAVAGVEIHGGEDAPNDDIGALGSAEGHRVSLSSDVDPAQGDRQSLEVLGHEVAHAMARGGAGETELDQPGDPGEARADATGAKFAAYVAGGMRGPAPRLQAATGGRARVHRSESAEHKDAVDGTLRRLSGSRDESLNQLGAGAKELLDPSKKIKVGSGEGVMLTPGEITAMMGDFYGAFDENGDFNPGASFHQLMNASKTELEALQKLIKDEGEGHTIVTGQWEDALKEREGKSFDYTDPKTGETKTFDQLGYLDLAARNNSHFSAETMEGTDNNMGVYSMFHEMALEEAQKLNDLQYVLSPEAYQEQLNKLRALESCGMHYLTDRHASGHSFEKAGVMDASGYNERGSAAWDWPGLAFGLDTYRGWGTTANLFVKTVHDEWNEGGLDVQNAQGDAWRAYGDGHWDDPKNDENRLRTAESVGTSWAELGAVLNGAVSKETVEQEGYGAKDTVPAWDPQNQVAAEERAEERTFAGVAPEVGWGQFAPWAGKQVDTYVVEPYNDMMNAGGQYLKDLERAMLYEFYGGVPYGY